MARTASYMDLITLAQLADLAMGSLGDQIETALRASTGSGDGEEIQQAALVQIASATKKIEGALNRQLMVREHTQRWMPADWREAPEYTGATATQRYRNYFGHFPVASVYSVDGDTGLADEVLVAGPSNDLAIIHYDDDLEDAPRSCVYYAGYRRNDQEPPGSGETWNTVMGTSGLTNLPDDATVLELPADIAEVCANIVVASMRWQFKGLVGITERTVQADRLNFNSRRAVQNYIQDQISQLRHHRKTPF